MALNITDDKGNNINANGKEGIILALGIVLERLLKRIFKIIVLLYLLM